MKKIFILGISIIIVLSFTACTNIKNQPISTTKTTATTTTNVTTTELDNTTISTTAQKTPIATTKQVTTKPVTTKSLTTSKYKSQFIGEWQSSSTTDFVAYNFLNISDNYDGRIRINISYFDETQNNESYSVIADVDGKSATALYQDDYGNEYFYTFLLNGNEITAKTDIISSIGTGAIYLNCSFGKVNG